MGCSSVNRRSSLACGSTWRRTPTPLSAASDAARSTNARGTADNERPRVCHQETRDGRRRETGPRRHKRGQKGGRFHQRGVAVALIAAQHLAQLWWHGDGAASLIVDRLRCVRQEGRKLAGTRNVPDQLRMDDPRSVKAVSTESRATKR